MENKMEVRTATVLATAKNVDSTNAAMNAVQRARGMMDKYQIEDMTPAQIKQGLFTTARADKSYKFAPLWRNILAVAVAEYNDCQALRVWDDEKSDGYTFLAFRGFEPDVTLAVQMFSYLADAVETLCKAHMLEHGYGSHYIAHVGDGFKKECVLEIIDRLLSMTTKRGKLTAKGGQILTAMKTAAVSDHFGEAEYIDRNIKMVK